jgi:2-polyprenyl-6-methoxyphenol hydroxylase-like FAD-dependent oxidoreductase
VASRFRRGRLFLAGEAAHAYSPATGQGLNARDFFTVLAAPASPPAAAPDLARFRP